VEIIIQEWLETAKELGPPHPRTARPPRLRLRVKARTLNPQGCATQGGFRN
jgi:hypothetical protein